MKKTLEQVLALEQEAQAHDGNCSHCGNKISIYRHRPNTHHAKLLKAMADHVKETGINKINFDALAGAFSIKSQRTKMRQHGLIAKYKEDGKHVPNTWLITTKGYDFLRGRPIPAIVIVYDNQVIGHGDDTITINDLLDAPDQFEASSITEPEAKAYRDIHDQPKKRIKHTALCRNAYISGVSSGDTCDIEIERMQVGRPIKMYLTVAGEQKELTYKDVAAFQRAWQIIN